MAKQEDSGHSFLAYFKRATSPLAVLRILSDRPMYGYELIQGIKTAFGRKIPAFPAVSRPVPAGGAGLSRDQLQRDRRRPCAQLLCRYACRTGLSAADAGRVCRDFRRVSAADGGLGRT